MTNAKIEKIKGDIARTKSKIAEYSAKLREQEKSLKFAENETILAMFRDENVSDEQLKAVRRAGFADTEPKTEPVKVSETNATAVTPEKKEDTRNAITEQ
jgi:hypothetical protein